MKNIEKLMLDWLGLDYDQDEINGLPYYIEDLEEQEKCQLLLYLLQESEG